MAQVLERVKTFFVMLTQNDNVEIIDDENIEKAVEKIRAQESRNISKLEEEVGKVNIPLEDETKGFVDRAIVDEKQADKIARNKQATRTKTSKERQLGE